MTASTALRTAPLGASLPAPPVSPLDAVLHCYGYGLDFLRELVADVSAEQMTVQPMGITNHPAWVLGHLTFVCQMIGSVIGVTEWLSDDWAERFGPGSRPVADARQYEAKDDALMLLGVAQARVVAAVSRLDDTHLNAPFPVAQFRKVFPTVRHALTQVLVGHTSYHVGQVASWRRAMGLPRLTRSFE